MKQLMVVALLAAVFSFSAAGQTTAAPASELLKVAYQQAAKEKKNVFVIFHASWCGWCHKMDTSMNDPSCKKFFTDNYVIVHLVVDESKGKQHLENPGAEELKVKHNGANQGIPFWLVFDKDGQLLADSKIRKEGDGPDAGDNSGCPASEKEVEYFITVLQKTANLSAEQEQLIRKRFRKNEI